MPGQTAAERGQLVRQRLLGAAAELIGELGWGAVSTRNLADRAQVAPGLVHYHFRSLPALLREAATGAIRQVLAATGPAFAAADTLDAGLALMLGALDRYTGTDPMSLLFTETYLAATRDAELRAELATLVADFRRQLADWLLAHRVSDPDATAAVLAATIDGVLLHRALDTGLTASAVAPVLRRLLATAAP